MLYYIWASVSPGTDGGQFKRWCGHILLAVAAFDLLCDRIAWLIEHGWIRL